jgi:hypothetical protein
MRSKVLAYDYRKMTPRLEAHCNEMLGKFHKKIVQREPPGLLRIIAMYRCVRLAYERANEEPERLYWKAYLGNLERSAEVYRAAYLKRRGEQKPVSGRERDFWRQYDRASRRTN